MQFELKKSIQLYIKIHNNYPGSQCCTTGCIPRIHLFWYTADKTWISTCIILIIQLMLSMLYTVGSWSSPPQ